MTHWHVDPDTHHATSAAGEVDTDGCCRDSASYEQVFGGARPIGPECRDDKHRNCDGDALDDATDEIVQCTCGCHTFARLADDERTNGNVWRL